MHGKAVAPVHTDYHICIDQGAAVAFGKDEDLVIVFYLKSDGIGRGHVDVPLGNDHAVVDGQFTLGADQSAAWGASSVAGLADHAGKPDLPGIGKGKLHLGLFTILFSMCSLARSG